MGYVVGREDGQAGAAKRAEVVAGRGETCNGETPPQLSNTIRTGVTQTIVPAAFTAVLAFPHARRPGWREHRTVCLPDFQGVGIGNAMSELVASLFVATAMGKLQLPTFSCEASCLT